MPKLAGIPRVTFESLSDTLQALIAASPRIVYNTTTLFEDDSNFSQPDFDPILFHDGSYMTYHDGSHIAFHAYFFPETAGLPSSAPRVTYSSEADND